jgi:hypothetical protein
MSNKHAQIHALVAAYEAEMADGAAAFDAALLAALDAAEMAADEVDDLAAELEFAA